MCRRTHRHPAANVITGGAGQSCLQDTFLFLLYLRSMNDECFYWVVPLWIAGEAPAYVRCLLSEQAQVRAHRLRVH